MWRVNWPDCGRGCRDADTRKAAEDTQADRRPEVLARFGASTELFVRMRRPERQSPGVPRPFYDDLQTQSRRIDCRLKCQFYPAFPFLASLNRPGSEYVLRFDYLKLYAKWLGPSLRFGADMYRKTRKAQRIYRQVLN